MSSFHDRQKSLFNHLKDAEEQCSFSTSNRATSPQGNGTIDRHMYRRLKHEMKQFRGRESIFKRPEANIRECVRARTIPDHIKNPQKYKYYSLSDVTPDQMSDATNTATALAFIREIEDREANKNKMELEDNMDGVFKKPTFRISSSVKRMSENNEKKIEFRGNKIVMPEYVVGVTKKVEKKNKPIERLRRKSIPEAESSGSKVELKLDHLYDEDD